jgi:hypothetical protein
MRTLIISLFIMLVLSACSREQCLVVKVADKEGTPISGVKVQCSVVQRDDRYLPAVMTNEKGMANVRASKKSGSTRVLISSDGKIYEAPLNVNVYMPELDVNLSKGTYGATRRSDGNKVELRLLPRAPASAWSPK